MLPLLFASLADAPESATAAAATPMAAAESLINRDAEGIGMGLILGAPTGFSAAWRPGGRFLVDGGVAWSFVPTSGGVRSYAQLHIDAAIDLADLRTSEMPNMHFPIWMGVGPRTRLGDGTGYEAFNVAIRMPFGMGFWHDGVPVEGFIEIAPGVGVFPRTEFIVDAALGVRFYIPMPGGAPRFKSPDPSTDTY
ncbi:MAG: hypothetical protein EXR71_07175 [Myxococcales bacterium]|nr:hypothetical protein [Myxococcales bacterium]